MSYTEVSPGARDAGTLTSREIARKPGVSIDSFHAPGRSGPAGVRRTAWSDTDHYLAVEEREDRAARRLTRAITLFLRGGERWRRIDEEHRLVTFAPDAIAALFDRAGFAGERLERYDDLALRTGWHAYAATRI